MTKTKCKDLSFKLSLDFFCTKLPATPFPLQEGSSSPSLIFFSSYLRSRLSTIYPWSNLELLSADSQGSNRSSNDHWWKEKPRMIDRRAPKLHSYGAFQGVDSKAGDQSWLNTGWGVDEVQWCSGWGTEATLLRA